jgi:ABC-2 type transport system ATP-binding protein
LGAATLSPYNPWSAAWREASAQSPRSADGKRRAPTGQQGLFAGGLLLGCTIGDHVQGGVWMTPPVNGNGTGSPEAMIDVDHLSRYYGPVAALKDVTFRANRGEIVGFLGPNGAGKTTTMRILTGFLPPSGGAARVAGYDVVNQSMAARQAIGYLPENTPLYTEMTVRGYLTFMARLRRVPDRGAAVEDVMGRVGIEHRADDVIAQLSKGLKQRVGIAQALVHDPEVVILDEPTIGLDPNQIRDVQGLIGELRGNHTVILSTHILS